MSSISTENLSLSSLGADAGISNLNVADIPANITDGDSTARKAYVEGLAFEDVLVDQFTQQLAESSSSDESGSLDDSDATSDGTDGAASLFGASDSAYSSLVPQTLTDAIMSNGGLGIADEIAEDIDPALALDSDSTASATSTSTDSVASSSDTTGAGALTTDSAELEG